MMKQKLMILGLLFSMTASLTAGTSASAVEVSADCACTMNALTGELIYDKNAEERRGMASTTKIITALVAIENCPLDDIVTVSENAANQEGSSAYIKAGDQFYLSDLLYGLMLNSGNDAAVAIAEHVGGSVEQFVDMMNQKAWTSGAADTQFANPNGLSNDYHFTTAKDLATLTRLAMQNGMFREIVRTTQWTATVLNTGEQIVYQNHNKLLSMYPGAIGVKTGYTDATGRTLVSAAERDGMTFISVTLNDNDDWNDHMAMLDDAYSRFYPKTLYHAGDLIDTLQIDNHEYRLTAASDIIVPSEEKATQAIKTKVRMNTPLQENVHAGDTVGFVEIYINDINSCTVDIVSEEDIPATGIRIGVSMLEDFKNIVNKWLI